MKHKESKIEISINLDENKIPEKIFWSADDANVKKQQTKATFISVWDDKKKESLRIDLWTKDMPLDDMKLFFFQIFSGMAQTYRKATQDEKMYQTILDFTDYFAEKNDIFKK